MDPLIWKHLPSDLVRKIVLLSNPTIDVRVAFRLPSKKLCSARKWRLHYLLHSAREGLVYNIDSQSLHIFRIPGYHLIRRPVELNVYDEWMTILNQEEKEHVLEITHPDGRCNIMYSTAPFITELPVLLAGSGIARVISYHNFTHI